MIRGVLHKEKFPNPEELTQQSGQPYVKSEEVIFVYFLKVIKDWPANLVLFEFKRLFIQFDVKANLQIGKALTEIIYANDQVLFLNVLKRCVYILVNNWQAGRNPKAIQELIESFEQPTTSGPIIHPKSKRIRSWLTTFCQSQDYQDLKLFAVKYEDQSEVHWSQRYTSYLLVNHYIDSNNPREQREAAKVLSQQLKDRFKFDLAMYAARLQSPVKLDANCKNPTSLGDDVLRLIKTIVAKRGSFSYASLANIFLSQTQDVSYKTFKNGLQRYLVFSLENRGFVEIFTKNLWSRIDSLYENDNEEIVDRILLIKTCNKVIEYLTTENNGEPSLLFILLISQDSPLTLAIVLLKIVMLCPASYIHLEAQLGKLVRYYEAHPSSNCQWFIKFLEIFKITFAIQAENVEYNLVKLNGDAGDASSTLDDRNYRVFSREKKRL